MQSTIPYPSDASVEEVVKYVEVPVIEEVIKYVPKKQIVEVEKVVPRYEVKTVEKPVEVPVVEYKDVPKEVIQYKQVIKHVPKPEVIDVPREYITEVPRIEKKVVEQVVHVPGKVIEVPKPVVVEKEVTVPRFSDADVPTVVAQQLRPVITESRTEGFYPEVNVYEPYLVPVDVYVPRGVEMRLVDTGNQTEEHRPVDIPVPQFNSLLVALNRHIDPETVELPFVRNADGSIPMTEEGPVIVEPLSGSWKRQHIKGELHVKSQTGGVLSYPPCAFAPADQGATPAPSRREARRNATIPVPGNMRVSC